MTLANTHNTPIDTDRHLLRTIWLLLVWIGAAYLLVPAIATFDACPDQIQLMFKRLGGVMGLGDAMRNRQSDFADVIWTAMFVLFFLGVVKLTRWILGGIPQVGAFTQLSALAVAVMVMAMLFAVLPIRSSTNEGRGPSVISMLNTVHSQLDLYKIQHNGQGPKLETFWASLTNETDVNGNVLPPGVNDPNAVGPYLQQPTVNSITGDSIVAANNSGSWKYDEHAGDFWLVLPASVYKDWFHPADMRTLDIVPASYEMENGKRIDISMWNTVWAKAIAIANAIWGWPFIRFVALIALWWFSQRWITQRLTQARMYDQILTAMPLIGGAALIGMFAGGFFFAEDGLSLLVASAFIFLWSLDCRIHLLKHPHYQHAWHDGSACIDCGYNLTGTLASNGLACPECGKDLELSPVRELTPLRRVA